MDKKHLPLGLEPLLDFQKGRPKEGGRGEGSQGKSHGRKVPGLRGERAYPESWLLRQAGKAGYFEANMLVMGIS